MSELQDLPRVSLLLRELCGLAPGDEHLPLRVLINIHRGVLRAPLATLGSLQERDGELEVMRELGRRYPDLVQSFAARDHAALSELYKSVLQHRSNAWPQLAPGVRVLMYAANASWVAVWPAVILHRLTWAVHQEHLMNLSQMLEITLRMSIETRVMLRDLAVEAPGVNVAKDEMQQHA